MKLLFIGDIIGKPGRELLRKGLRPLVEHFGIDLVVANAENSAAGFGITKDVGDTLLELGVDVMTSGNHIWDKKEAIPYIGTIYGAVLGAVFMQSLDDPFAVVLREIEAIRHRTKVILVDFHAEATSEKIAMGWHLDGKATLVVGTHTHVQTADERILPNGTAYLTDAGMTGPHDSIIGMEREPALARFLNAMPAKFEPATGNPRLNGIVVEADEKTGKATAVTRISYAEGELVRLAVAANAALASASSRAERVER